MRLFSSQFLLHLYKTLKTEVFNQCVSTATVTSVTGGILGSVVNDEKNCIARRSPAHSPKIIGRYLFEND